MPFIEISEDLNEDYEDKPVAEGEYDLRIIAAEDKRNKADTADMTEVIIEVEGEEGEGAANVFHYINYPSETDNKKQIRFKMLMITAFVRMFEVPFESNGFNSDDLPGLTGRGLLTQELYEKRHSNKLSLV